MAHGPVGSSIICSTGTPMLSTRTGSGYTWRRGRGGGEGGGGEGGRGGEGGGGGEGTGRREGDCIDTGGSRFLIILAEKFSYKELCIFCVIGADNLSGR